MSSACPVLAAIRTLPPSQELTREDLLGPAFRLYESGRISIYYAPFDHVNPQAKVALIGITPGWSQMKTAFETARTALLAGRTTDQALSEAKYAASFAGSMRKNLVTMLDGLGMAKCLGIESCSGLFDEHQCLLHTASAIRYPVFVEGANYTGSTPNMLVHPQLKQYIDEILAEELRQVRSALLVPLGKAVSEVLEYLAEKGLVEANRCLLGFPHPSGANGHRKREYEAIRVTARVRIARWFGHDDACPSRPKT